MVGTRSIVVSKNRLQHSVKPSMCSYAFGVAITLVLLSVAIPADAISSELEGIVSDVSDGDSLTLATMHVSYRIRLVGIDAPEPSQPYGKHSHTSLRELCLFKNATVETKGEDRYGRTLGSVTCAGVQANSEQVRRGMAWVFIRYAPRNSPLYGMQAQARARRLGLWEHPDAMEPWEWRRLRRATELGIPRKAAR
jgi:endonuclease YncB( thermonuclease family)